MPGYRFDARLDEAASGFERLRFYNGEGLTSPETYCNPAGYKMVDEYYRPTREERKKVTLGIRAAVGIRHGAQCTNHAQDQQHIIFLLNQIPASAGGTLYPTGPTVFKAPRDRYCDPSLAELIRRFQVENGLPADGVVDPDGPTLKTLNTLAATKGAGKKPAPARGTLPDAHLKALHRVLDASRSLLADPGFVNSLPPAAREFPAVIGQIEAEMAKQRIPLGKRAPTLPGLPGSIGPLPPALASAAIPMRRPRDIAIMLEALELLLLLVVAMITLAALAYLLQKLKRILQEILRLLCKNALQVLTSLDTQIRRNHAEGRHRCNDHSFIAYQRASNVLKDVLEAGYASRAVVAPAVRAFWHALKALMECLSYVQASAIVAILGTWIAGGMTFIEFIWFWLL